MSDFVLSVAAFGFIGFELMFGESFHGIVGNSDFVVDFEQGDWRTAFFFKSCLPELLTKVIEIMLAGFVFLGR